jgi:hypothetical protein
MNRTSDLYKTDLFREQNTYTEHPRLSPKDPPDPVQEPEQEERGRVAASERNGPALNTEQNSRAGGDRTRRTEQPRNGKKGPPNLTKQKPDQECYGWARRLRKALLDNSRQVLDSLESCANQFRTLRDHDHQEIEPVLKWYCAHCGVEDLHKYKLPSITGGKQFRTQFGWIMERMYKFSPPKREPIPETKEGKDCFQRISGLRWPCAEQELLDAVHLSVRSFREFLSRFTTLHKHLQDGKVSLNREDRTRLLEFVQYVSGSFSSHPADFVEYWFRRIHKQKAGWDGWGGDLRKEVFSPDHELFQKMGYQWSMDYSNNGVAWQLFKGCF